jgi:hypothetical protein
MGQTFELQPWVTIQAATGVSTKIQDVDEWVNTKRFQTCGILLEVPKLSGCTLVVEGCDDRGGSFTTLKALTASFTAGTVVLLRSTDPYGSARRLTELIRWRLEPDVAGPWEATFRVNLVMT